ncbi:MAG: DUF1588 domain-containing protein [Bdellovibrionales bacterium]|nr:DUF1588 domain-containing protein [Bdellovibrionales bacterium]
MKFLISFAVGLVISTSSVAKPLSAEGYLTKISERLTGKWPSPHEFSRLKNEKLRTGCSQVPCLQDFFRTYIGEKMDTGDFYSEAVLKTYERFGLRAPERPPFPIDGNGITSFDNDSTEDLLVYRVFKLNRPIDELFTSQVYWRRFVPGDSPLSGFIGFEIDGKRESAIQEMSEDERKRYPEISSLVPQVIDLNGHPNIAGLFSTKRFLERYWNSPANGNRKRAAAIFKIMLCDEMAPALERDQQQGREEALALGVSEARTTVRSLEEIHRTRHANQKDCRQCHMRLDPMARTMRPLELGVAAFPSPGNLKFYNSFDDIQDIPVKNFSDLIRKATQQQKYVDCQLNWLVTWIMGRDVDIHPVRFATLIEDFEKSGRNIKSSVENLLLSPEFQGIPSQFEEPTSLTKSAVVLEECQFCHGSFLKTRGDKLKLNLAKIAVVLDLTNDGRNRTMPPKSHWWEPTAQEVQDVKTWIQEGAPLVKGEPPILNPDEVQRLLQYPRSKK